VSNWLNARELQSPAKATPLLTKGFASAIPNGDIGALRQPYAVPVVQPSLPGRVAIGNGPTGFSKYPIMNVADRSVGPNGLRHPLAAAARL